MAGIRINCPGCDQELEAPDELAGQIVECPSCGQTMMVPEQDALSGEVVSEEVKFTLPGLEEAVDGGKSCPECGVVMEKDAVLCVNCGYHFGLGKKMTTELL